MVYSTYKTLTIYFHHGQDYLIPRWIQVIQRNTKKPKYILKKGKFFSKKWKVVAVLLLILEEWKKGCLDFSQTKTMLKYIYYMEDL